MKLFHISDLLSVTTGRLVSNRHMDGIYNLLNFLTGDSLFTHQLGRASQECEPWLRTQFPQLFPEHALTATAIGKMDELMGEGDTREQRGVKIAKWVEDLRVELGFPEMIPVYEMGADMHTHIDPIEELEAMVGKKRVVVVDAS